MAPHRSDQKRKNTFLRGDWVELHRTGGEDVQTIPSV